MTVIARELLVADTAASWESAGFSVVDGVCTVGSVSIRLGVEGTGIVGWSLDGVDADQIDGVPVAPAGGPGREGVHPNGVTSIDHVVLLSPYLARTVEALRAVGLEPRRERDGELGGSPIKQVFYRLGEVILEVVGSADAEGEGPSSLWGITFNVADIDATAAYLGERTSPVKDAVQSGRRITTLRHRDFGMSVRTALISVAPSRPRGTVEG